MLANYKIFIRRYRPKFIQAVNIFAKLRRGSPTHHPSKSALVFFPRDIYLFVMRIFLLHNNEDVDFQKYKIKQLLTFTYIKVNILDILSFLKLLQSNGSQYKQFIIIK